MAELYEAIQKPVLKTWVVTPYNSGDTPKKGSMIVTRDQMCTNPGGECRFYTHLLFPQEDYRCTRCISLSEDGTRPGIMLGDGLLVLLIGIAFLSLIGAFPSF